MWEICQLIPFHIQYLEGRQLSYILRKGRQLIIMKIQNLRKETCQSPRQPL